MPPVSGILHMFAASNNAAGRKGLAVLIKSAVEYTSSLSYVCEYKSRKKRIELLKDCKFKSIGSGNTLESFVFTPPTRKREDFTISDKTFDRLSRAGVYH